MTDTLMKTIICCAQHDHATASDCEYNAKETTIPLTAEEIAQQEEYATAEETKRAEADAVAEALATLKASAKAKLVAGTPLTEEEAATLVI